jgi:hypothetical protein
MVLFLGSRAGMLALVGTIAVVIIIINSKMETMAPTRALSVTAASNADPDNDVLDAMFGSDDDGDNEEEDENGKHGPLSAFAGEESAPSTDGLSTLYHANSILEVRPLNEHGSQLGLFSKVDLPPGVLILVSFSDAGFDLIPKLMSCPFSLKYPYLSGPPKWNSTKKKTGCIV